MCYLHPHLMDLFLFFFFLSSTVDGDAICLVNPECYKTTDVALFLEADSSTVTSLNGQLLLPGICVSRWVCSSPPFPSFFAGRPILCRIDILHVSNFTCRFHFYSCTPSTHLCVLTAGRADAVV